MLKVMLVDDEKSILQGLQYLIDWHEYGFEVATTARNGREALEIIKQNAVDLIITDIKMPYMDGLELIANVKKLNHKIKFIVISGYSEFEYAKKAIDVNVIGYLLKPIDEGELANKLKDIRREHDKYLSYFKHELNNFLHAISNGNQIHLDTDISNEFISKYMPDKFYYMTVELTGHEDMIYAVLRKKEYEKTLSDMICGIKDFLGEQYNAFVLHEDNIVGCGIVVSCSMLKDFNTDLLGLASGLKQVIAPLTNMNVSVMIGKKVDSVYDIHQSKESIEFCRKIRFYIGVRKIISYDENKDWVFHDTLFNMDFIKKFPSMMLKGEPQDIESAIDEFCNIIRTEAISPEIVIAYINNIMLDVIKTISELGGETIYIASRYSVFCRLQGITVNTIKLFLKEVSTKVSEIIRDIYSKNEMGIVGEIVDYIEAHYQEDIDLQYFANHYYINASYLGQLFKKKVGMSFNKYLNHLRMEEAKRQLQNNQYKIYEIAQNVGYKDANYFCMKFKEYEGISPTEYRRKFFKQFIEA